MDGLSSLVRLSPCRSIESGLRVGGGLLHLCSSSSATGHLCALATVGTVVDGSMIVGWDEVGRRVEALFDDGQKGRRWRKQGDCGRILTDMTLELIKANKLLLQLGVCEESLGSARWGMKWEVTLWGVSLGCRWGVKWR